MTVTAEPEFTEPEETVSTDCDKLAGPGFTTIVGIVEVTALPPTVALIVVAVPATKPVNVAE